MASEGSRLLDEALKLMAEAIKVKLAEMEPTSDVASASAFAKGTFTPKEVAQMGLNSGVACASVAVEGTNTLGEISVDADMEPNFVGVASSSASSKGSGTPGEVVEDARVESTASAITRYDRISNVRRNIYPRWRMKEMSIIFKYLIELAKCFEEIVYETANLENLLQKDGVHAFGGGTSLHWAVRMEDVEAVTYILEACKEDVNAKDDWWRATALHWAVRTGNTAVMNAMCTHHLESKKFDLGVLDRWGFTALECAIFKSHVPMVQALLRFGIGHSDPIGVIKEVSDELRKDGSMEVRQHYFESQRKRWYERIQRERGGRMGTVLHWALLMEDTSLATQIFTKGEVDVNATDSSYSTPLHLAVFTRNLDMVKMMVADSKVDVNSTVNAYSKEDTPPLQMAILLGELDMVKIMVDKHLELGIFDVNYAERRTGHTVLHCAVLNGEEDVDIVRELLRCKDTMRLTEECESGETPLQIAHERGFKDIEKSLLECEGVQRYMDQLYRDRQVYVDAANAILVGAALIASVTFASWLQPPLGYGTLGLVDVQHNPALRAFWIFNCLSFYFAIGTVVFGARSVLPRSPYFIKVTVEKLRTNLLVTASLLACSVFFVIIAFGIAGCLVLSPMLEFQLYMIVPAIGGGLVCIISLVFLSKSVWEDSSLGKSTALVKGKKWKRASLVKSESMGKRMR